MTAELNPAFTFDAFVIGASNRLAVTAARTASENPGSSYNPLIIYSPTGLGKTHLLMAIGHRAKELAPELKVEYWTLHEFVEAFQAAVAAGDIEQFRSPIESTDVVLLDDVQFLSHSKEVQSELLRLAVEFQRVEKQIVLTSDRPLAEIAELDDRLLGQLGAGLLVDIAVPEFETRLAILQRRVESTGTQFSAEVLTALAEIDVQHVRALLGLFNRLQAFQSVQDTPVTPDEARSFLLGQPAETSVPVAEESSPLAGGGGDEFGQFLSGLAETVTQQVDGWRDGIAKAVEEWSGRGYNTDRLEALLGEDIPGATSAAVRAYEETVQRLRGLEAEIASLDPDAARNPVFKLPDRLEEAEELVRQAQANFVPPPGPSEVYSLEQFEVGESTRMAVEAGRAVIEQPGTGYNPLVIVGPSGVGKTHLLHGIGCALRDTRGLTVACLSAEILVDELVYAIQQNAVAAWRARYRQASAFLLDDVQKLASRQQSQDELFQLFNLFADAGRQLVFTCDVPPEDIEGLDDRLTSRMMGGLTATISPPDPALRRAMVASRLAADVTLADPELVDYLAERATDSARSLLSIVQRVTSGAEAMGATLSVAVARKLLEAPTQQARPTAEVRTSGVMVSPTKGVQSREKFVWEWPDPLVRIVDNLA